MRKSRLPEKEETKRDAGIHGLLWLLVGAF